MERLITAFLSGLSLTILLIIVFLPLLRRLKVGQEILSYVKLHVGKKGTPTMGGIAFIISIIVLFFVFLWKVSYLSLVVVIITAGYGLTGFLDDFIKLKYKRNMGLRAWQKAGLQIIIAVIVAIFQYTSIYVNKELAIPFTSISIDVGIWLIPIVIVVFLSCTNGVNLTDGLDGLACSTSIFAIIGFIGLILVDSLTGEVNSEMYSLSMLSSIMCGALVAFLLFNCFPAKVFMGDTGSMAIGAFIACVAVFSGNALYLIVIGVMYVVSCLSVIIQVFSYKISNKRVFLMSPYHHHLQMKGASETRVMVVYSVITIAMSLLCVAFRF